ncbi:hypothetical protein NL676_008598 [Syzygium grande]|nr:hypothetical protein NL676_008598 [Syzygium grande]
MLDSDRKAAHRWRPWWSTMARRAPRYGQTTVKATPEQVSRPFPTKRGAEATEQRSYSGLQKVRASRELGRGA